MVQLSHPFNLKSMVIFHLPTALLNEKKIHLPEEAECSLTICVFLVAPYIEEQTFPKAEKL